MGTAFLYGNGSGTELAIKVIGGTQRPETGKQGTIWINTDQKITGWTIQVKEPTAPTEGMVWIQNITSAKLNALKKNGIWFTPTSAKQYISGAWCEKIGEYYNNNQWTPFFSATINVTYPAGSICTATDGTTTLTAPDTSGTWACVVPNAGTWTVTAKTSDAAHIARQQVSITSSGQTASVALSYNLMIYDSGTINSNIGMTTDGYTYGDDNEKNVTFGSASIDIAKNTNVAGTTSAVDVTNYSTLRVTMKSGNTSNTTQPWCALCKEKTTTGSNLISRTSPNSTEKITKKIDISSLSGSYYIVIASSSSTGWGTIYDIYLEC